MKSKTSKSEKDCGEIKNGIESEAVEKEASKVSCEDAKMDTSFTVLGETVDVNTPIVR